MLVCLRTNEFEENHCSKEIDAFVQCAKKFEVSTLINFCLICFTFFHFAPFTDECL